jgi:regulator of protease activity HflC (stomatin/prohibitin superfamily)
MDIRQLARGRTIVFTILGLGALVFLLLGTFYIVPEGHVAVVKFTGKADRMEQPGFQVKIPFFETVEIIEVRERKNVENMAAATANQLPATATVSINWTVNRTAAMDLFIKYGGLDQFEERVLDPRMRSAAKAAISRFRADQIIRERQAVVAEIEREIGTVVSMLPITISQAQLENIDLPQSYLDAVLAKEQAREQAEREKHNLERQRLEALQRVNTAEAVKQSAILTAQGQAEALRLTAEAEADAIRLVNAQLAKSPLYIDLVKAKAWNGELPRTLLGENPNLLLNLPSDG